MEQAATIPHVDVTEAARRLSEGAARADGPLLVDVRERNEYATVHVPGAVLVPLSEFAVAAEQLPPDRPLLLMCAAGKRSLVASEHLIRNGRRDVTNVTGGITAWQAAGLPVADGAGGGPEGSR
jgi:rhodanese-related sulfurtransferase